MLNSVMYNILGPVLGAMLIDKYFVCINIIVPCPYAGDGNGKTEACIVYMEGYFRSYYELYASMKL